MDSDVSPRLDALALAGQLAPALDAARAEGGPAGAWRRGWVLAAMGRYGEALDELAFAAAGSPVEMAAACGTRASVLRQVGLHARARTADEEGLAHLARPDVAGEVAAGLRVGCVADAVGLHPDGDTLDGLLATAREATARSGSARQAVRLDWVTGEVLMLRGDPVGAAQWFQRARRQAMDTGLRRHEAKSVVFLAATNAATGNLAVASAQARDALAAAGRCGAEPLRWPALSLIADTAEADEERARHRAHAGAVLDRLLTTLPAELADEARRSPPAVALLTGGGAPRG